MSVQNITEIPSYTPVVSPFADVFLESVRHNFDTSFLGGMSVDLSAIGSAEIDLPESVPVEPASPEALTVRLHDFLAETQATIETQLLLMQSSRFVSAVRRQRAQDKIGKNIGENIILATSLINELFEKGSDVLVSTPDLPRPLELTKIGFNDTINRYSLRVQEYHKNIVFRPAASGAAPLPIPQGPIQITFHAEQVQFSVAQFLGGVTPFRQSIPSNKGIDF